MTYCLCFHLLNTHLWDSSLLSQNVVCNFKRQISILVYIHIYTHKYIYISSNLVIGTKLISYLSYHQWYWHESFSICPFPLLWCWNTYKQSKILSIQHTSKKNKIKWKNHVSWYSMKGLQLDCFEDSWSEFQGTRFFIA